MRAFRAAIVGIVSKSDRDRVRGLSTTAGPDLPHGKESAMTATTIAALSTKHAKSRPPFSRFTIAEHPPDPAEVMMPLSASRRCIRTRRPSTRLTRGSAVMRTPTGAHRQVWFVDPDDSVAKIQADGPPEQNDCAAPNARFVRVTLGSMSDGRPLGIGTQSL